MTRGAEDSAGIRELPRAFQQAISKTNVDSNARGAGWGVRGIRKATLETSEGNSRQQEHPRNQTENDQKTQDDRKRIALPLPSTHSEELHGR